MLPPRMIISLTGVQSEAEPCVIDCIRASRGMNIAASYAFPARTCVSRMKIMPGRSFAKYLPTLKSRRPQLDWGADVAVPDEHLKDD